MLFVIEYLYWAHLSECSAHAKGKRAEWPEEDLEKVFVLFKPLGDALLKATGAEKLAIFVGFEKKKGVKP